MAIRKIAQMGHPVLRRRAEEVPPVEIPSPRVQALIDDMIETMRDADGAGIAAPQVHESVRICVIEVGDNPRYPDFPEVPLLILVNPVIRALSAPEETITLMEGCLSVAGIRGRVTRPRKVHVTALDRNGSPSTSSGKASLPRSCSTKRIISTASCTWTAPSRVRWRSSRSSSAPHGPRKKTTDRT